MTYIHTTDVSRVRDGTTWWAVAVVIVLHVLLMLWLMTQRWSTPLRPLAAAMVFVDLRSTPDTAVGRRELGAVAPSREANPTNGRASSSSDAARRRELTRMDLERRFVSPAGIESPGSAAASQLPSNPIDGFAVSGLGTSPCRMTPS